jgi:hypothetical protein
MQHDLPLLAFDRLDLFTKMALLGMWQMREPGVDSQKIGSRQMVVGEHVIQG